MKELKTLTCIGIAALLLLAGCQSHTAPAEMTAAEKETAKKEIAARIDEIIAGCTTLNVDAALRPYADTAAFRIVTPDARITDYPAMKVEQGDFFKQASSIRFTTIKEDFKFLSATLVLCTWTGKNDYTLKTGDQYKIDPYVGSMLFSKTGKEWKIIYAHESAAQPVKQ